MAKNGRQYIDIPLNGVDTNTNPRRLDNKVVEMKNLYQPRTGEFAKRLGFENTSVSTTDGGTLQDEPEDNRVLFAADNDLCLVNAENLYTYYEEANKWIDKGFHRPVQCSSINVSSEVHPRTDSVDCSVHSDSTQNIALHIYNNDLNSDRLVSVIDLANNTIIYSGRPLSTRFPIACVNLVISTVTRMYIIWSSTEDGIPEYCNYFDTNTYTFSAEVSLTLTATPAGGIDIIPYSNNYYLISYHDGTNFYMDEVDEYGDVVDTYQKNTFTPTLVRMVRDDTYIYIFTDNDVTVIDESDMSEAVGIQAFTTDTPVNITGVQNSILSGGGIQFFYEAVGAYSTPFPGHTSGEEWYSVKEEAISYIRTRTINQSGTLGTDTLVSHQLSIRSKPIEIHYEGTSEFVRYLFLARYIDSYSGAQSALFLIDSEGNVYKKFFPGASYGLSTPQIHTLNGGEFYTAGIKAVDLGDYDTDEPARAILYGIKIDPTAATNYNTKTITAKNQTLVSGGPGAYVYEPSISPALRPSGFWLYPSIFGFWFEDGSSDITEGTHGFTVIYEWTDINNNIYRSAPGVKQSYGVTAGAAIGIGLPIPHVGYKDGVNNLYASVYMTAVDGNIYYKALTEIVDFTEDYIQTMQPDISDADLIQNELLYTTGGVLENILPPSCFDITMFEDKVLAVPELDRTKIWASKPLSVGLGVEFSDSLIISADQGGDIVGLQSMDGKCFVFKKDSIYYFTGEGANALGIGSYSSLHLLNNKIGCVDNRTISLMEHGILFANSKGIHLLGRDHSINYIGKSIEDMESFDPDNITGIITDQTNELVYFCMSDSILPVWDYGHNAWYLWEEGDDEGDNISPIGCMWKDKLCFATIVDALNGKCAIQDTSYTSGNSDSYYFSIKTPWIAAGGVTGHQLVNSIIILGEYSDDHDLVINIYHNYDESTPVQTITIEDTNLNKSPYIQHIIPEDAECMAIQVKIAEDSPAATQAGAKITGIILEVLPMDGVQQIIGSHY